MPFVIHATQCTHGPYICKVDENWYAKWIQYICVPHKWFGWDYDR